MIKWIKDNPDGAVVVFFLGVMSLCLIVGLSMAVYETVQKCH